MIKYLIIILLLATGCIESEQYTPYIIDTSDTDTCNTTPADGVLLEGFPNNCTTEDNQLIQCIYPTYKICFQVVGCN